MNRILLALLLTSCAATTRATRPEPEEPKSFDVAAIDQWVEARLAALHVVGGSLAVVRNGEFVLVKGYGLASRESGEKVTPETEFGIGSLTKQFTCAAALLLGEDGKLSLDRK